MIRPVLGSLALLLAACSSEPERTRSSDIAAVAPNAVAASPGAADATPMLAIDTDGLRLFAASSGAARAVPFGMEQATVMRLIGFRGAAKIDRLEECGAGPLDTASFADGLTLYFQDGRFAGWSIGETARRAPTTAAGIGIGSNRAEIEAAYEVKVEESTLGTEFQAGGLFGILDGKDPKARVTHLWGGISCNFR